MVQKVWLFLYLRVVDDRGCFIVTSLNLDLLTPHILVKEVSFVTNLAFILSSKGVAINVLIV
jgi:hypothetical protein